MHDTLNANFHIKQVNPRLTYINKCCKCITHSKFTLSNGLTKVKMNPL